jgi:hypothetical protein
VFTPGAYSGYNKAGINSTLNSKFQCKLLLHTTSLELYMKFQDVFGNTCNDGSTGYLSPFRVMMIFLSLSMPEKKCPIQLEVQSSFHGITLLTFYEMGGPL